MEDSKINGTFLRICIVVVSVCIFFQGSMFFFNGGAVWLTDTVIEVIEVFTTQHWRDSNGQFYAVDNNYMLITWAITALDIITPLRYAPKLVFGGLTRDNADSYVTKCLYCAKVVIVNLGHAIRDEFKEKEPWFAYDTFDIINPVSAANLVYCR